jgi:hypothetical protein
LQAQSLKFKPQSHKKKIISSFLYTNSEQTEKEIKKTIPFIIASRSIKYLEINLMKEVKDIYNKNHKSLKKKIKEDIRRYKALPCYGLAESIL